MKPFVADVVMDAERLLKQIVPVCAAIPQKYKYLLGTRLMELALVSLVRAQDAARVGPAKSEEQLPLVEESLDSNHKLQALLDVAYELGAFSSKGHYDTVLQLADKVAGKSGGWLRQIKTALPVKQNPEPSPQLERLLQALERLGALSTDATPAGVKP